MIGTFENLAKTKMVTWHGWAMYFWDHAYKVALSADEPHKDSGGYYFDKILTESVSPYFLRACGIDVPFDGLHEDVTEYYYGAESDGCGNHNPIEITLTLPKALLEQLNLEMQ
jgi:hypothetical protein